MKILKFVSATYSKNMSIYRSNLWFQLSSVTQSW